MFHFLAQQSGDVAAGIVGLIFVVIYVAVLVVMIVGAWKMYVKAGRGGWECLIPFWNLYAALKIVGRPGWWLIFFFLPIVSLIFAIILASDLARSFGRGIGTTVGLIFLPFVFMPILGFGQAQYQGPAAAGA